MTLLELIKLKNQMTTFEKYCINKSLNRLMNKAQMHKADSAFGITLDEAKETIDRIINLVFERNPSLRKNNV